jgi:SAM-dependent methyltransferase
MSDEKYSKILLTPLTRTFKRWKNLTKKTNMSLYRSLTYENINGTRFNGKTIDIGGGNYNSYYHLLEFNGEIDSLNIDAFYKPTIIADLNENIPVLDEAYDNLLSLNTYEHIYNFNNAISESFRILKNNGTFIIAVPFLYRVHASPYDFNRLTPYWWEQKFKEMGLNIDFITIEPLVWDSLASGYFTWRALSGGVIGKVVMLRSVFRDRKIRELRLPRNESNLTYTNFALGFIIKGKKVKI